MLKEKFHTFLLINILQKKQLMRFFCIFFILIIIPVIISSAIIYYYSNNIIEKEIKKANSNIMDNMITYIDEELQKIKLGIVKFSLDNDLKTTLNIRGFEKAYMSEYKNVMQKLAKLEVSDLEFSEVFIYYFGTHYILSREGLYDFKFYFNKVNKFGNYDTKFWEEYLSHEGDFEIISTQKVSGLLWQAVNKKNMIAIKTSLPFYSAPNAVVVIFIDEEYFRNAVVKYGGKSNTNYTVLSKDGDIITSYGDSAISNTQKLREYMMKYVNIEKGNFKFIDACGAFSVTFNTSPFIKWVYMTAVPFKEISNQSKYIRTVTLYIVAVFVIIGLFTAFWLGKKQYKPIATLVEYLDKLDTGKEKRSIKKDYNEFNFITGQFNKILSANESLENSFSAGMPFLKENLLYRILNGNILSKPEINEELKKYNIEFTENTFKVIIIKFDILNDLVSDNLVCNKQNKEKIQHDFSQIRNKLFHVIFTMLTKRLDCYQVEIDIYNTAYIVNCDEGDDKIIIDICKAITDFFNQDEYQVRLTVGIGSQCYKIEEIQNSFSQAIKATKFRSISRKNEIIIFSDELIGRNKRLFEIFDTDIKAISNSFLSGNYEESINLAHKLLEKCVDENLTYEQLEKIIKILMESVFHIISIKGCKIHNYSIDESDIYEQMASFYSIEEYKQHINEIFTAVGQQLKEQGSTRKDEIVNFMVNYVKDNYSQDIYLESIADELGMSSNYLSHFFKDYMGVSFSDFLGKIRVEKAKEMISTTNKSINSICFEVGYINVNSFIRSFKKFEGITPGRYRDIISR